MYSITLDNGSKSGEELLYSPLEAQKGYAVISPMLKMELNKAATLDFIVPPTNPQKNKIYKLKTILRLYDGTELIYQGRCRESKRAFDNLVTHECESELAFLQDVDIAAYGTQSKTVEHWARFYLDAYNDKAPAGRKISLGTYWESDTYRIEQTKASTVGDEFLELMSRTNSKIAFRRRTDLPGYFAWLDIHRIPTEPEADSTSISTPKIEFRKNLLDLAETVDSSELVTRIKPYGKEVDGVRVTGAVQTNSAAESSYNTVVYRIVTYSNLETAAQVEAAARADLEQSTLNSTISVSAVDLSMLGLNYRKFEVGKVYRVVSEPHGVDAPYMCSRIELDLTHPDKNKYVFGATRRMLTETVSNLTKGR